MKAEVKQNNIGVGRNDLPFYFNIFSYNPGDDGHALIQPEYTFSFGFDI